MGTKQSVVGEFQFHDPLTALRVLRFETQTQGSSLTQLIAEHTESLFMLCLTILVVVGIPALRILMHVNFY